MRLPGAIREIAIPSYLSPSQLSVEDSCLLKSVLGSTRNGVQRLIPHPRAEIGNIVHKLMELAIRGKIEGSGDPTDRVKRVFEDLLESAKKRFADDPRHLSYIDLQSTMSPLEWRRKVRFALDSAMRLLDSAWRDTPVGSVGEAVSLSDLVGDGRWAEVSIIAPTLRLAGRVDIIERQHDIITIRDLKTGRVKDETGDILPHIRLQMYLYGLMARSIDPGQKIRLVIDHNETTVVPFGDNKAAETEEWLLSLLSKLPLSGIVATSSLATFGHECSNCSFRHQCTAYLSEAPKHWCGQSEFRLPLDIWGVVQSVKRLSANNNEIGLVDQASRSIKVFGLRDIQLQSIQVKKNVWMFGLASDFKGRNQSIWNHPLNFYEFGAGTGAGARNAWCLQVYSD